MNRRDLLTSAAASICAAAHLPGLQKSSVELHDVEPRPLLLTISTPGLLSAQQLECVQQQIAPTVQQISALLGYEIPVLILSGGARVEISREPKSICVPGYLDGNEVTILPDGGRVTMTPDLTTFRHGWGGSQIPEFTP